MFTVYEVTTGAAVADYADERKAWAAAYQLNDDYAACMGLEFTVRVGG